MKSIKIFLCIMLAIMSIVTLCACGNSGSANTEKEQSPEEIVRTKVKNLAAFQYFGKTIGGKEITRSAATITNVKKISDTEYNVSGKMVMTDIYGTDWTNTFDCAVTKSGDSWHADSFDYTSKNWTKG